LVFAFSLRGAKPLAKGQDFFVLQKNRKILKNFSGFCGLRPPIKMPWHFYAVSLNKIASGLNLIFLLTSRNKSLLQAMQ